MRAAVFVCLAPLLASCGAVDLLEAIQAQASTGEALGTGQPALFGDGVDGDDTADQQQALVHQSAPLESGGVGTTLEPALFTEAVVVDPDGGAPERFVWGDTERLRRFAPPDDPSLSLFGVDLGVSFVERGRLHFLFGDSWSVPDLWDRDPVATVALGADPGSAPLEWHRTETGAFSPLGFSEPVGTGAFEVPVEGLSVTGRVYVFFATDFDPGTYRHATSVLAHQEGEGFSNLVVDHRVASDRFINISAVKDGKDIWLFGSGDYRKSPVYLARATTETLTDRSAWEYMGEMSNGEGLFVASEDRASPLIDSHCVGELSVRRDARRELYLMTYNCLAEDEPRGIHLRIAKSPVGPWSEPIIVLSPERDAYGTFMHRAVCGGMDTGACVGVDDRLSDPGREGEWGGEYGAYLIEPWISSEAGLLTLHYTLSSWNPYAVHLMKTTLLRDG